MEQKNNKGVIALLFVGVLMGALDISIVGPAIPSIESNLHIGPRFSGWIFSIYVLFNLIGISLFARLSDVFGRRKIYVLALGIFAIGSLWVSVSKNFDFLIAGRAIQGFGASGIFPVASAVVGDLYPKEKRGRILGLIGAVFGIAFLIGPFVAGILLHYLAWNFLFIINLPISAVLIFYGFRLLPTIPVSNSSKIDWGGIFTLGLSLASLTLALNTINPIEIQSGKLSFLTLSTFLLSIFSALFFIYFERKAVNPIIRFSFFKNRQIIIAGVIAIVTGVVQACFVFIPKFVVQSFDVEPSTASFMLTPFVLAVAVGSPVFGRLIDKFGVKSIVIAGLFFLSLGFFILSITNGQKLIYYTSGVFVGLGLSVLAGSSLRYIMLNNTSTEDRAVSQGMLTIFISLGQLTGTAVIGLLLASLPVQNSYSLLFIGVSILAGCMFLLAFRLKKA